MIEQLTERSREIASDFEEVYSQLRVFQDRLAAVTLQQPGAEGHSGVRLVRKHAALLKASLLLMLEDLEELRGFLNEQKREGG